MTNLHSDDRPVVPSPSESSFARLLAVVEASPTAKVMIDRAGIIVLVNRETEKLFGYQRTELLGASVELLVPTRFQPEHPAHRTRFFDGPTTRRMGEGRDLFGLHRDGHEIPVEIGLNPIETDEGLFVISAIVDITERKRLEVALRQVNEELETRVQERTIELERSNQALERSNLELQQFAYIASHDLQSPLRAISGFVQLLQRRCGSQIDEQAKSWIRSTIEATERMQRLITDLLEYSRVETSTRSFELVSMNDVFRDTTAFLELAIRDCDAVVACEDLPTVHGDRTQLIQLLQNLIGNALKYRGPDRPIIRVSAQHSDPGYTFTVADNGIGIDPKHHVRIFELGRRLHTQQQYPGTGIGLAVCRRVVQRHGGTIWVESDGSAGARFLFTLPDPRRMTL